MLRMPLAGICGFALLVLAALLPVARAEAPDLEGRILTVPRPRQIVAVSPGTGAERVLFRAGDGLIIGPAATPDGRRIAFILRHWRRSGEGSSRVLHMRDEIWVMDGDGSGAHPVRTFARGRRGSRWIYPSARPPGARGALGSIDISNDGSRLLIAEERRGLFTLDVDGHGLRRIRTLGATPSAYTGSDISGPQFSPDGRKVIAFFFRQGAEGLGTVSPSGGTVRLLPTRRPALAGTYSDDGRWIAFVGIAPPPRSHPNAEGRHTVWVMRSDGSGERKVADRPGLTFYNPDFSPDGGQLVFGGPCKSHGSRIVGKEQVCVYAADVSGRGLRRVARGVLRFPAENPEWVR
jgi:Tol biopolymer transport system component